MRNWILLLAFLSLNMAKGQYHFSGHVSQENAGKFIYLSMVEDYRKSSRIYLDQIIRRTKVDSTGSFQFKGNNLPVENRIYRIHLDNCEEGAESAHFLGKCQNSPNVLFIGNNSDSIQFPTSFENQALCTVESTNIKSQLLLDVEAFKEEMIFDFTEFRSDTNLKLNLKNWFSKLQEFGESAKEPLVELYIFDFLSDKKNETYGFYLDDIVKNSYYENLLYRLQATYPNTSFTKQYQAEITTDEQLASFENPSLFNWKSLLFFLLIISLSFNVFLVIRNGRNGKASKILEKLTPQEQKIVDQIKQGKSNKEIAATLFVSHSTVKTHINNLYKKLNVSSREDILTLLRK
ncbi:response regulator transcription factor [Flagellimonas meridianipacifica]|uniref:Regulatory LuxR family protein n=1 Tax=Flagellimonas meridianipacifica TaxID=1080225 RepID=A0A2T0MEN3_9FLAO|nr:LuxR C-terminal-related transcriptional regulator [Allomuricauda pacifica]PRX56023.1 regulatory LuxR family protein [Allomuricauda pacifica]